MGCVFLALGLVIGARAQGREADFGRRWVRTHPFFLTGSHFNADLLDLKEYVDGGFNLMLVSGKGLTGGAYGHGLGLPLWVGVNQTELAPDSVAFLEGLAATPGITGWYVRDEPPRRLFEGVGRVTTWLEETYPDARSWKLYTPPWATKNHYFYEEKCGFRNVGEEEEGIAFLKEMS